MTTSTARHRWVDVYDPEDTVIYNLPGEAATVRLTTTPRDTDAATTSRLSFGVLSESGEQPLLGIDPATTAALDALQLKFERFASAADMRPGRHRARGLFARLLGSKGGA